MVYWIIVNQDKALIINNLELNGKNLAGNH
jgi:hypothetical protein